MRDLTMNSIFERWSAETGMTKADCRALWSIVLEQVYWALLRNGSARLLHVGLVTISDEKSVGVRFKASKFVREIRRQVVDGDPDEDSRWIANRLRPLRGNRKKRRSVNAEEE